MKKVIRNDNIISKDYEVTYDQLNDFNNALVCTEDATKCFDVNTLDVNVYILLFDLEKAKKEYREFSIGFDANNNPFTNIKENKDKIPCLKKVNASWVIDAIPVEKLGGSYDSIKKEFIEFSQIVFEYDDEFYLLSHKAYITLFQRLNIDCGFFNKEPTLIRGEMISYMFRRKARVVKFITREKNGTKVVFAVNSKNFAFTPQTQILNVAVDISSTMNRAEFLGGTINADYTTCYLQFPEDAPKIKEQYKKLPKKDEFVPGLMLQNSDCGRSSFVVSLTIDIKRGGASHLIRYKNHTQKHNRIFDTKKIVSVSKKMVDNVNEFPKLMCKLLELNIASADVEPLVKTIVEEIELAKPKYMGKKIADEITDQIVVDLQLLPQLTMYDIVMAFITAKEFTSFNNEKARQKFQEAMGNITKVDFETITSKFITS